MGTDPAPRAAAADADLAAGGPLRAAGGDGPAEPPGHPLALGEDAQRRLLEDVRVAARSARIAVRAPGMGEAVLAVHEVVRFPLSTEGAPEG